MSFRSGNKGRPEVPSFPAQPKPQEVQDIINEISGTQTITVTGADGKRRRVTQRMPRTPQEQKMFEEAETLLSQAVTNIGELYRYNPNLVANYQPFIQTFSDINAERQADLARIGNFADIANKVAQFKDMNKAIVTREFDQKQRMSEETLAARGLGSSTQASEERAYMNRERALAEQQADVNASNYGEDLASRQLSREMQAYQAQDVGRQARLEEAGAGWEMEERRIAALEANKQNALAENRANIDIGNAQRDTELKRAHLGLSADSLAQGVAANANSNANQRWRYNVGAINDNYQMRLDAFNSKRPSFLRRLTDVGMGALGMAAGSAVGAGLGGIGAPAGSTFSQRFGQNFRG